MAQGRLLLSKFVEGGYDLPCHIRRIHLIDDVLAVAVVLGREDLRSRLLLAYPLLMLNEMTQ